MLIDQGRDGRTAIAYAGHVSVFQGMPQPTTRSAYLRQVERIAPLEPPGLLDRDAELAELTRFCLDPDAASYAWWRAEPWAGKSALLSAFVLRPPAQLTGQVQIVSFFILARLAAQDTREAFTDVLQEQLAALLGQSLPAVMPEARRESYLLDLMTQAAAACRDAGGRLVLVIDGLDEDRGVTTGPHAHSIAGLLPASPPAGMRVIVAGRPNPPVPDDVPDWHPLRNPAIIRPLVASPHARDIQRLGRQELQRLLHGSPAEQDLLGLLVAARGGLSAWDLAELAGVPRWEATDILDTVAGRTFSSRPSSLDPTSRPDVYLLAHDELQAAAAYYLGDRLAVYREQLHSWAVGYRARGWPTETPEYLLAGYFRLLEDLSDLPRMTECALDLARHDCMLDLTGGDGVALTEARTTLDRVVAQNKPDLTNALALACHRDHLADRNAQIPVSLPAVWATLGQLSRAKALATSSTNPDFQAQALAEIARALARAGQHQQAKDFATQAETIARSITPLYSFQKSALAAVAGALAKAGQHQHAEAIARSITDQTLQACALADVAGALAKAGQQRQADAIARSITDQKWQVRALGEIAGALAEAGQQRQAEDFAAQAEAIARSITAPNWQAIALADVTAALVKAGQQRQAEAIAGEAEAIARSITQPDSQTHVLAEVARTLAKAGLQQQAKDLTAQAGAIARSNTDGIFQAVALADVAEALAEAGQHQQAVETVLSIAYPYWQTSALAEVAGALARAGQRGQAKVLAGQAEAIARPIIKPGLRPTDLVEVAAALAEAGQHQQAEAIARFIAEPKSQATALIEVAKALAEAGQHQQAKDLTAQAEAIARSITDQSLQVSAMTQHLEVLAGVGHHQQAEALAAQAEAIARSITDPAGQAGALTEVAGALAGAGQHRQAEAIARSIADPQWQVCALAEVAGALAQAGHLQRAKDLAAQALLMARSITEEDSQMIVLAAVAEALARVGQHRKAEAVARSIANPEFQAGALVDVAGALARAGQHEQAELTACTIADPYLQARALAQVAVALAQAGDVYSASRVAAATCAVGRWTTAVRPVVLLEPSAFTALTHTLRSR